VTTEFCTVAHSIYGPSVWKLPYVTLLVPRILKWFLDLRKCTPLIYAWFF